MAADVCPSAIAYGCWSVWNCFRGVAGSPASRIEFRVASAWAAVATATRVAAAALVVVLVSTTSPSTNGYWQALDNASLSLLLARVHAIVDGKIPANHVCRFCRFVSSQFLGRVSSIAGVFTIVDSDAAGPSSPCVMCFEEWVCPSPTMAKVCQIHDVEHLANGMKNVEINVRNSAVVDCKRPNL